MKTPSSVIVTPVPTVIPELPILTVLPTLIVSASPSIVIEAEPTVKIPRILASPLTISASTPAEVPIPTLVKVSTDPSPLRNSFADPPILLKEDPITSLTARILAPAATFPNATSDPTEILLAVVLPLLVTSSKSKLIELADVRYVLLSTLPSALRN